MWPYTDTPTTKAASSAGPSTLNIPKSRSRDSLSGSVANRSMITLCTDPEAIMRVLQDDAFGPSDKKTTKLIERSVARANRDLKEIEPKIQKSTKRKAPTGGADDFCTSAPKK